MSAQSPVRHDFYRGVHKGLRLALARLLTRLGNVDAADASAVRRLLADLRGQLVFSAGHLHHEDAVIHTALAPHAPEAVAALEAEHDHHRAAFEALEAAIVAAETSEPCAPALHALYIRFSQFVAEDFAHMAHEETVVMPLLQSFFTDAELHALEGRIIASQSPEEMVIGGRMIMSALSPAERLAMAAGARAAMPPPAFEGMMAAIAPALEPADADRLLNELGMAKAA